MNSKAKKLYTKIKVGDLIEFGYRKVWHVSEPEKVDSTKNLMYVVNGECFDSNHNKISGLLLKYNKKQTFGMLLSKILEEYTNVNIKHECGGGAWQYRNPYIRIVPPKERALIE